PESLSIALLMLAAGALASLGHFLLIAAHRLAPASVLSPFIYSQLAWTVALGYVVFGDVPNRWTMTGAGIVIASGLYLLHRERVRRSQKRGALAHVCKAHKARQVRAVLPFNNHKERPEAGV